MPTLRVQALHIHPVKSLGGVAPEVMTVEPWGPAGDRRWAVVDADGKAVTQREQPRLALASARPLADGAVAVAAPGMDPLEILPPTVIELVPFILFGKKIEAALAHDAAHDWFSAFLGAPVRLVHLDRPDLRRLVNPDFALPGETVSLADGFPVMVANSASLDALNSLIAEGTRAEEGPLPMNRFRPNVVVSGAPAWAEDHWRRLAVGGVEFRVARTCGRCVITTTDQATAERGKEPLRTLARHRAEGKRLIFGQLLVPVATGTVRLGDEVRVLD
ncbi:MOSC N-terminal beta barrel domain-containing protein [Streptomyces sp. NPDC089919]|uniref:MOSC domain-containing protein n=1 Tax=Streptomyces sp. NPDC089919 TaxID=3155188 RepID=UPI003420FCFB